MAALGVGGTVAVVGLGASVPADDLYYFGFYSLAAQAILWTVIGVGFAALTPRLFGRTETGSAAPAPAG